MYIHHAYSITYRCGINLLLDIHVHVHAVMWANDSGGISIPLMLIMTTKMKGTEVQTLGARAVAGAWCMAGCLGHNYYYGHGCNY